MSSKPRWSYCYTAKGDRLRSFVVSHFSSAKTVLLIGGAGFDQRATAVAGLFSGNSNAKVDSLLFREERPNPPEKLLAQAERNLELMRVLVSDLEVVPIRIFSVDGNTVTGGRLAVTALNARETKILTYTDVVLDFSAISIGVSFPVAKYLLQLAESSMGALSLHMIVASCPEYDDCITAVAGDVVTSVHGFRGNVELAGAQPARLWLPQLKLGQQMTLTRIHDNIDPDDICPILPFPAVNPRMGDALLEAYSDNLKTWEVDPRDVIYASEGDPLDVYRTIVRICVERDDVFSNGESLIILSPIGSKIVGIGSLMAALERNLSIRYVEAESYEVRDHVIQADLPTEIVSIWVIGGPEWVTAR